MSRAYRGLGSVDGFGEDDEQRECDEGAVVLGGLLAAQGNALETLELADGLLDAGACPVERLGEVPLRGSCSALLRDHGSDARPSRKLTVGVAVIALVADDRARRDIRTEIEKDREMAGIARLAAGEVEGERQTVEVRFQMDLGGEAAAAAPQRLIVLPPLAPAAETCARAMVLSNNWTMCALSLVAAR